MRLGGQNSYDYRMISIHGAGATRPDADKPSSEVDGVSGRVRDAGGKAIGGVALTVVDSVGHEYRTTSDPSGRFSIKSGAGKPDRRGSDHGRRGPGRLPHHPRDRAGLRR